MKAGKKDYSGGGDGIHLRIATVASLAALNAALISFYALWLNADTASINAMENSVGYDENLMLPNSNITWIAAHASLLLVILVDALFVVMFSRERKSNVSRDR